jgi:hypothetical protein
LKPGVTLEQANADLMVIGSHLPRPPWTLSITIQMLALNDYLYGNAKTAGWILLAAAGFLLWSRVPMSAIFFSRGSPRATANWPSAPFSADRVPD